MYKISPRSWLRCLWGTIALWGMMLLMGCSTPSFSESLQPTPVPVQTTPTPQPTRSAQALPPETQALLRTLDKPLLNPPRGEVRLAVISDLNSAYGSTDYEPEVDQGIALLPFWQPDLVLCGGDMVAGQSLSLSATDVKAMWVAFNQHITAPLQRYHFPFGFTIGNHDGSAARDRQGFVFQQDRDLAAAYWNDPRHDPGLNFVDRFEFPFYYTFQQNDIFYLVWDGSAATIPSEKLAWVETALASKPAQSAKLRIVIGHLPLYGVAIGRDHPGDVLDNADAMRAMLEKYHVHTYISGHHHAYYPGHRGQLQLLDSGLLGAGARRLIEGDRPPYKSLTLIDIHLPQGGQSSTDSALTTYTTYDLPSLKIVATESLPRFLTAHNGLVLRRDLEWQNLSPTEQATCIDRLGTAGCN